MSYSYRGPYKKWKIHSIIIIISVLIFFGGFIWLFFGHYSIIVEFNNMIAFGLLVFTLVMTVPLFISLIQICCKLIKKDNYMWNPKTDPYALAATAGIVGTALLIPALILLFKIYSATLIIAFSLSITGTLSTAIFGLLVDAHYKNR